VTGIASQHVVVVPADAAMLHGQLTMPACPGAVVLVVDEAGEHAIARHVAGSLNQRGVATLLTDALTADERMHARMAAESRSNVQLIARRLVAQTDWLAVCGNLQNLPIGYFAASDAAAAALGAAADRQGSVSAIVAYDARPLLAAAALPCVRAPTLFITHANNHALLKVNRAGFERLLCPKRFELLVENPPDVEHIGGLVSDRLRWPRRSAWPPTPSRAGNVASDQSATPSC